MTFGVTKKLVWIETGAKTHFIIYVPQSTATTFAFLLYLSFFSMSELHLAAGVRNVGGVEDGLPLRVADSPAAGVLLLQVIPKPGHLSYRP